VPHGRTHQREDPSVRWGDGEGDRVIQALAFYLFAFVVVLSGALTIASRNPVHSVMWLILAFFNAAGLMILVGAEFIAMLLVIVYVGAVAVLFLFVVMMLDIDFTELRAGVARYFGIGLALAVALAAEVMIAIGAWSTGPIQLARRAAPIDDTVPNIQAIGNLLYTRYLFVFEGAGLVLLVAMIGAIVLTHRQRGGVKAQNISRQNARRPQDATRNTSPVVGQGVEL
jgi:NADH-quinone oxidoreductase subunit J